jgi:hypothetical protein
MLILLALCMAQLYALVEVFQGAQCSGNILSTFAYSSSNCTAQCVPSEFNGNSYLYSCSTSLPVYPANLPVLKGIHFVLRVALT